MSEDWLRNLKRVVSTKCLVVLQFEGDEWRRLCESRKGTREFTIARSHDVVRNVKTPTACILFGKGKLETEARIGVMSSRANVSTLETRVKVRRAQRISPRTKEKLTKLISEQPYAGILQSRLASDLSLIVLPNGVSVQVIERLSRIDANHTPMRLVAASLSSPKYYRNMAALQQGALDTALRAFGLASDDEAISVELVKGKETALASVNIMEDSVIEHDARYVKGYDLAKSDVTGRAIFEKDGQQLEVYTANRRLLEKVFGVDLIYLNLVRRNIVMVQYKMLDPSSRVPSGKEWIYRPDSNFDSQVKRMQQFRRNISPLPYEYRLNPEIFYLKFVKRDGALRNAGITMPMEHFEKLRKDRECLGPKGGFRISFESLAGRYLRQTAFLDLIRSGYIGAHAKTTNHLRTLLRFVLKGNRAAVAAIQSQSII